MSGRQLPSALHLPRAVYSGWACAWCGASLLHTGGTSAGIARGRLGAHVLDTEVYACPACAPTISRPSHQPTSEAGGARPSTQGATVHNRRNL
ncbi:hypothetical protein [Streptomyces sp. NPDC047028]|uniref:hypothetical protein n=1 Tax=Streptomyces sp. NPDC047028 TaxID=3155793 RepID=UPI0033DB228B